MASLDLEIIENTLTNPERPTIQLADSQWVYANDTNNNSYSVFVQWIITSMKNMFLDIQNSYLSIPLHLEMPNIFDVTKYLPAPPLIAFRESVYSLFQQVIFGTDQGASFVNEPFTAFVNHLRLNIEYPIEWAEAEGSLIHFYPDRYNAQPQHYIGNSLATISASASLNYSSGPNSTNPTGSGTTQPWNLLQNPVYAGPQGDSVDALYNTPNTNDPNDMGQPLLGSLPMTITNVGGVNTITGINGVTVSGAGTQYARIYTQSGMQAYIMYTQTAGAVTNIGGIALANAIYPIGSLLTVQALGFITNSPDVINVTGFTSAGGYYTNTTGSSVYLPLTLFWNGTVLQIVSIGQMQLMSGYTATSAGNALLATSATGTFVAGVNVQLGRHNPNCNYGYLRRCMMFQSQSQYTFIAGPTGTTPAGNIIGTNGYHSWNLNAIIPLRYLHDFFAKLNFASINIGYTLQLYFAQQQGANGSYIYPPFLTTNNNAIVTSGTDMTPNPYIYYGGQYNASVGLPGAGCKWFIRVVKFEPENQKALAALLTNGFTKTIEFVITDFLTPATNPKGPGVTIFDQLTNSLVHPLRVTQIGFANITTNAGSTTNIGIGNCVYAPNYSTGTLTGYISQSNIQVNSSNYFKQNFQYPPDHWEQLREQFPIDSGAMLTFDSWLNYKRYMLYDLTRLSDRLISPTEPVSLIFTGTRADGQQYGLQVYYIVEKRMQTVFRITSSDVSVVVGNIS